MFCLAFGSDIILNLLLFVLFITSSLRSSISSPSSASISGDIITLNPRFIAFCKNILAKPFAIIIKSYPFKHDTACSLEEPQPKLLPATIVLPFGISLFLSFVLNSLLSANANCGVSSGRTVAINLPGYIVSVEISSISLRTTFGILSSSFPWVCYKTCYCTCSCNSW